MPTAGGLGATVLNLVSILGYRASLPQKLDMATWGARIWIDRKVMIWVPGAKEHCPHISSTNKTTQPRVGATMPSRRKLVAVVVASKR